MFQRLSAGGHILINVSGEVARLQTDLMHRWIGELTFDPDANPSARIKTTRPGCWAAAWFWRTCGRYLRWSPLIRCCLQRVMAQVTGTTEFQGQDSPGNFVPNEEVSRCASLHVEWLHHGDTRCTHASINSENTWNESIRGPYEVAPRCLNYVPPPNCFSDSREKLLIHGSYTFSPPQFNALPLYLAAW